MKKILFYTIVTFVTLYQGMYSQDFSQWENCTSGMEGFYVNTLALNMENYLYLYTANTFYTNNNGKSWKPLKQFDSVYQNLLYKQVSFINKYEDAILELENFESNYASQEAALLLAKIYAEKDLSKAIKYLENKVYEYSDNSLLCNYLGKLFYGVEDYENAYETWKKSKQKDEEVKNLMLKIKNKI